MVGMMEIIMLKFIKIKTHTILWKTHDTRKTAM